MVVPAAPTACLAVFKSPVSVQEEPLNVSVSPLFVPGGAAPPTATAAVCNPVPAIKVRAKFKSATSVNVVPSYVSV